MKKCLVSVLIGLFVVAGASGQSDKRLVERLDCMLVLTQVSDFDRILDFTYPKLFTIVPREAMLKALRESLDGDEFTTAFDSIRTVRVFPVFTVGNGSYAKITHTMQMIMSFKEALDTADIVGRSMLTMIKDDYGESNVYFDQSKNTIRVSMLSDLVAVKDEHAPEWSFVNYDDKEDTELARMLFSDEVLKKLRTFQ